MNAFVLALALAVPQQQDFINKFDNSQTTLEESLMMVIAEGYQNGFDGIHESFTEDEHVKETKESFGNGLRQIRLSTRLTFDEIKKNISIQRTSNNEIASEYGESLYDYYIPNLIGEIRAYVSKRVVAGYILSFTGEKFKQLERWCIFPVLTEEKNWRIDSVTPMRPIPIPLPRYKDSSFGWSLFLYPR